MCQAIGKMWKWTKAGNVLDVGLVDGDQRGVDGDGDGSQMEVIKEDGQVVMEAPSGGQVDLEGPRGDAGDPTVAPVPVIARPAIRGWGLEGSAATSSQVALVAEPELQDQVEVQPLQGLFNLDGRARKFFLFCFR